MSFFNKVFENQRGNILLGLIAASIAAGSVIFFLRGKSTILDHAVEVIKDDTQLIEFHSAVESLKFAFFESELNYHAQAAKAGCENPNSFITALKIGSGCQNPSEGIKVFDKSPEGLNFTIEGGCLIKKDITECGKDEVEMKTNTEPVLFLSLEAEKANDKIAVINQNSFSFYLFSIQPEKAYIEFIAVISSFDKKTKKPFRPVKKSFAIKTLVSNFAHIEVDGRVTQEKPGPLARCPGAEWATYNVFNPDTLACTPFVQLGSGTGLAFYNGRYFGFRPMDGQIIDLFEASTSSSYIVREDGTLNGDNIFPSYKKENLINVDDITIIEDSLYFVRNFGETAHIGYYSPTTGGNEVICELGKMGWGLAYSGIAAHSSSQNVHDESMDSVATFYLKTDSGDFLIAYVLVDSQATTNKRQCFVTKDPNLQQVEYKRTHGFDRAVEESRLIYY